MSNRKLSLTLARIAISLVSLAALALPDWHDPLALRSAVDEGRVGAHSIVHTLTCHLAKVLFVPASHRLREGCQALDGGWADLVVNPDREEGHTGPVVLEGQVEALATKILHHPGLCVHLQMTHLGDLVRCDGGHLTEIALAEARADVRVGIGGIEVEGLLAGQ